MPKSPFKFLDSYTKEDIDIFFGRDREIEAMYQKVFESKILLVYGISGTGKTSIINCGLANKFEDSDWLPISIRRGTNINDSLNRGIAKLSLTPIRKKQTIDQQFQSLYLDHFKPIYIIVDQFEELFIFGDKEEREEFIQTVKRIVESEVQCRFIFSIREEYLAGVTEFEHTISDFLSNRMRIEKMTWSNAKKVIEEPCRAYNIEVEEGLTDIILGKLSPERSDVELTYLQVLLDRLFWIAVKKSEENPAFSKELLTQIGDVSDLLGSFLEEQISQLDDPDSGLVILKSFVSIKGTKRQVTLEDISEFATTLGKEISGEELKNLIIKFVNLRILRDKDESGRYELRHDSLATKIYEKITLVEKELLEVRMFIVDTFSAFKKRGIYLSKKDIEYIAPYENKLFLSRETGKFITDSKNKLQIAKKRIKRVAVAGLIAILLILIGNIFKTYHFPLTGVIINLGWLLYGVWFVPVFSFYVIKTKENRTMNLFFLLLTLTFLGTIYMRAVTEGYVNVKPIAITEQRVQNTFNYLSSKNESIYSNIKSLANKEHDESNEYLKSANLVRDHSNELFSLIQELKVEIVRITEGDEGEVINGNIINLGELKGNDETNIPSEILIGSDNNGKAFALKAALDGYREFLLNTLDGKSPTAAESIENSLNTDNFREKDGTVIKWEYHNFQGMSVGFVIIGLSQIQCNLEKAEAEALSYLFNQMTIAVEENK